MKLNTMIVDPEGRTARVITLPIPGRPTQMVTLLYPDGRARLVDLAACRPVEEGGHHDLQRSA